MQYPDNDFEILLKPKPDREGKVKRYLLFIGTLLTPITLGGALWGYVRAYNRKLYHEEIPPTLNPLHPFARKAMIIFAALAWLSIIAFVLLMIFIIRGENDYSGPGPLFYIFFFYILPSGIISFIIMNRFEAWRGKMFALRTELHRFGSAKWASAKDLQDLVGRGLYIGGGYTYSKMGHLISIAGTRSGKFVNLIVPNLLGAGNYQGSWFVIDPKGEAAMVTGRYQNESGRQVHILDPWNVVGNSSSGFKPIPSTFNPLDTIPANDPELLADGVASLAHLIVPTNHEAKDPYWDNAARSIITGFTMYAIIKNAEEVEQKKSDPNFKITTPKSLAVVWWWLRLSENDLAKLLSDMSRCQNQIVSSCANELLSLKENTDNAYGSVMSTAQVQTDFLKSPALQASIGSSSFNISELTEGKMTIYVVIPPDKLDSQGKWLGLVSSSALRSCVANRKKRVTFILDEFPSLGRGLMKDVQTFMAIGAGYNITLWPIFQTLGQLTEMSQNSWQTFLGNAAVKHFWGIGDNFSASYVSEMIGKSTYTVYDRHIVGPDKGVPAARALATEDEVRRGSAEQIFAFVEQRPAAIFQKFPYWDMNIIKDRADPNPLYANISDEA